MNWPPDPKSWLELPAECLWYLLPGLVWHAMFFVVSLIVLLILGLIGSRRFGLSASILFQGYLLISSMFVNGLWSCIVWGRLYWSVDYTSDFSVFMPITRGQIDYSWGAEMSGGLNGITLFQLNLIWAIFAMAAWGLAFWATRWTMSHRRKRTGEQIAAGQPLTAE